MRQYRTSVVHTPPCALSMHTVLRPCAGIPRERRPGQACVRTWHDDDLKECLFCQGPQQHQGISALICALQWTVANGFTNFLRGGAPGTVVVDVCVWLFIDVSCIHHEPSLEMPRLCFCFCDIEVTQNVANNRSPSVNKQPFVASITIHATIFQTYTCTASASGALWTVWIRTWFTQLLRPVRTVFDV